MRVLFEYKANPASTSPWAIGDYEEEFDGDSLLLAVSEFAAALESGRKVNVRIRP